MTGLEYGLWISGAVAEAGLVLVLAKTRAFRTFPVFFVFACWSLVSDLGMMWVNSALSAQDYFRIYELEMVIDSLMIFAVLVELAWSVLRPLRHLLPKRSWIAIPFLIALAGLLVWPVAGFTLPPNLTQQGESFFRLQQTAAILRVVVFFVMAGFSQLIGIGWRNRELQMATGLGFYSILSLAINVLHTHQAVGPQYLRLNELEMAGYLGSLAYWVVSFATKEAERQNFSPQMANFLLLIGGTAKAGRVALTDFSVTKSRFKDH